MTGNILHDRECSILHEGDNEVRKNIFRVLLSSLLAVVLLSCPLNVDNLEVESTGGGNGSSQSTYTDGSASGTEGKTLIYAKFYVKSISDSRTIAPTATAKISSLTNFNLTAHLYGQTSERALGTWTSVENMGAALIPIEAGTWVFILTANGTDSGGAANDTVYIASTTQTLSSTSNESVALELFPASGKGTIDVGVTFPEDSGVGYVEASLLYLGSRQAVSTAFNKTYTGTDLASNTVQYDMSGVYSGTYLIQFCFYTDSTDEKRRLGTYEEVCVVRGDCTSSKSVEISSLTSYKVTFHANGGTFSDGSDTCTQSVPYKATLTARSDMGLTPAGQYMFWGWAKSTDGGIKDLEYLDTDDIEIEGPTDLYAVWVPPVLYVKTDGDDEEGDALLMDTAVATVSKALELLDSYSETNDAQDFDWTIKVSGTVEDNATVDSPKAASLLLEGYSGTSASDIVKSKNNYTTVVTIAGSVPVTINNLGITAANLKQSSLTKKGGGVHAESGTSLTLKGDAAIYSNESYYGAGIYAESNATLTLCDNTKIYSNTAYYGGGIYIADTTKLYVKDNTEIYSNTADDNNGGGGGIYAESNATLTLCDNTKIYSNNSGYGCGGGIYVCSDSTIYICGNTSIYRNWNRREGGGIWCAGTLFIYDNVIIGEIPEEGVYGGFSNSIDGNGKGGGIFMASGGALYMGYSSENTESTWTGGIYYNYAGYGGGIYIECETVKMASGNINYNSCLTNGAGIRHGSSGTLYISGGTIAHNKAKPFASSDDSGFGGGIYLGYSATLEMSGGAIEDNYAEKDGGGIYINTDASNPGIANISNVTIKNNTADNTVSSSSIQVYNSSLSEGGGGIYNKGRLTISSCTISGNTAANGGGVFNSGEFYFNSGTIENNTATSNVEVNSTLGVRNQGGGGIFNRGTLCMTGGTIQNNTAASGKGGAIYVYPASTSTKTSMEGSISIPPNDNYSNDTHLAIQLSGVSGISLKTLEITGELTASTVAGITLTDTVYTATQYASFLTAGVTILDGDATLVSNNYNKFTVSESGYSISSGGKLVKD